MTQAINIKSTTLTYTHILTYVHRYVTCGLTLLVKSAEDPKERDPDGQMQSHMCVAARQKTSRRHVFDVAYTYVCVSELMLVIIATKILQQSLK